MHPPLRLLLLQPLLCTATEGAAATENCVPPVCQVGAAVARLLLRASELVPLSGRCILKAAILTFLGMSQSISELVISLLLTSLAFGWTLGLESQEPLEGRCGTYRSLQGKALPSCVLLIHQCTSTVKPHRVVLASSQ